MSYTPPSPPPLPLWARHGPVSAALYTLSRTGDHGRLPPMRRLTQITDSLYVGGQVSLAGWRQLESWGVGAIVNLRMEWDDRRSGIDTPHALWLPTIDGTPPTTEQLGQGAKFIHQQINARRGVYVHCAAGLGRSPTQVMAYFISQGMAIEDAIKWVKLRRPFITLSPRQIARLEEFQSYWKDGHH